MYIPEPIKCKASGIVEDIIIRSHMEGCSNMYYYVQSDGKNKYVLHGQKKIEPVSWNFCHNWFNLTGTKLPKIGDKYYAVGADSIDSNSTLITSVGEKEYNNNINLPDCSNYNIPYPFNFDSADKCKVIGTIKDYEITRIRPIGFGVRLTVENGGETYQINTQEDIYFKELIPYYAGGGRVSFPIITDRTGDEKAYYPKEGDTTFAIVDKSNNGILKYGLEDYYKYKDIENCTSLKPEEIQKGYGISEREKVINKINYLHMREKVFGKKLGDEKINELSGNIGNKYFSSGEINDYNNILIKKNQDNNFFGPKGIYTKQEIKSNNFSGELFYSGTLIFVFLSILVFITFIYKKFKDKKIFPFIKQKTLESL